MIANVFSFTLRMMSLKIGINADSSTINGNLGVLDRILGEFEMAGFTHVEIPVHGLDCIFNGNLGLIHLSRVKRILDKFPFSYSVHAPDALNLADRDYPEIHAAALQATIDFAAEIKAGIVVYHGSWVDRASNPEKAREIEPLDTAAIVELWKDEIERLSRIAEYAELRGVTVAVENIFNQGLGEATYRIDPRQLAAVVSAVNSKNCGVCFDFGHAFISANEHGFSIEDALRAVLPKLVHVHIHDNFGKPAGRYARPIDMIFQGIGDLHLIPGAGGIPYSSLMPLFAPSYDGVFMMEIQPRFSEFYRSAIAWAEHMMETLPKVSSIGV